jgi:acetylornithine aminotransferase
MPFAHLSTFGGNPMSVAAGRVMFQETSKEKLLNNVKDGEILARSVFQNFEHAYIRGKGLMLGLVLDDAIDIDTVVQNIWQNKVFCGRVLYGSNTIRLYAPLNSTQSDIYNKFSRVRDAVEMSVR